MLGYIEKEATQLLEQMYLLCYPIDRVAVYQKMKHPHKDY